MYSCKIIAVGHLFVLEYPPKLRFWKMSSYALILLPLGCNAPGSRTPARAQPCGVDTGRINDGHPRFAGRALICGDGKVSLAVSPTFLHSRS
jgi:hypothetical protein